jgi:hypothetical protein
MILDAPKITKTKTSNDSTEGNKMDLDEVY